MRSVIRQPDQAEVRTVLRLPYPGDPLETNRAGRAHRRPASPPRLHGTGRLFRKFFLAFWLTTVMAFLLVLAYLDSGETRSPDRRTVAAAHLVDGVAATLREGGPSAIAVLLRAQEEDGALALHDAEGRWLAGRQDLVPVHTVTVTDRGGTRYQLVSSLGANPGRLADRALPIVIGALVSLVSSALLAWYMSRPLSHLHRAVRAIAGGALDTRISPAMGGRRDELADLAREVDRMAGRLQSLIESRRQLLHDIVHELQSPLKRLQTAIALLRECGDPDGLMLRRVERESQRLDMLIEELLTLARLSAKAPEARRAMVDLPALLGEVTEDANFEAASKQCHVILRAPTHYADMVDGDLLHSAFENVVRNAVTFTAPDTMVVIDAHDDRRGLHVQVTDQGPGVPSSLLEDMFEPFNRLPKAPGESGGGFGLGLAIARRAVEAHGGTISARTASRGGLVIEIFLPRQTAIGARHDAGTPERRYGTR